MAGRLDGKVALVTGASSGIGWATAVRLGQEGAAVGVCYRSNEDGAQEARRAIEEAGGRAAVIQGDISVEDDAQRTVQEMLDAFGRIDVLVNNAGMENQRPFLEMSLDDWEKVVSVNLTGAFLMSREALRHMVDNGGGVVVNMSSVHQLIPWPGYAHYAAAKGGLKL